MAHMLSWIEHAANGERVECVVVGETPEDRLEQQYDKCPNCPRGVMMSWNTAKRHLDFSFDHRGDFGVPPIYAWTQSRTIFLSMSDSDYDHIFLMWVPRTPMDINPRFSGQGAWLDTD